MQNTRGSELPEMTSSVDEKIYMDFHMASMDNVGWEFG
jgi:hypothetical protein